MATLATQAVAANGTTLTLAAATSGGDAAHVGDDHYLVVDNANASSATVTLATTAKDTGFDVADNAVPVAAGKIAIIGPLKASLYADANQLCQITYSGVTSLTVAVIQA